VARVSYDGGILVEVRGRKILFDPVRLPSQRPDLIAISHAHSDHVNLGVLRRVRAPILMSLATLKLLSVKGSLRGLDVRVIEEGEAAEVCGIAIEARSAGHIVGSLQYLLLTEPLIAYTGDFNDEARVVLRPARPVKTDVLIMEATYGDPYYSFPPRPINYRRLLESIRSSLEAGKMVVVTGRSPGVAQELVVLLSHSSFKEEYAVHPSILNETLLHLREEGFGIQFRVSATPKDTPVLIAKLSSRFSRYGRGAVILTCTGWALRSKRGVPLSSHADYSSLVNYAESCEADEIYTVYGYSSRLALELRRRGLNARALR